MSTIEDIDHAVEIFRQANCPFELMHCVSTYPMVDEKANLKCIATLRNRYNCDVGYSGHEVGLAVSYAASSLGISSLERHITLSRAMYGSDQSASVVHPERLKKQWVMARLGLVLKKSRLLKNSGITRIRKHMSKQRKSMF